jgi:hypothetical protein
MAASNAILGFNTTISVETSAGSGVYTEIAEVTNSTPPDDQTDDVEVTHMKSPNRTKEYIPGLTDLGTCQVDMNWIPSSATDLFIIAWKASGLRRSVKFVYPNGATDTFAAYPKGYSKTTPIGDKMASSVTLKVAGAVTRS